MLIIFIILLYSNIKLISPLSFSSSLSTISELERELSLWEISFSPSLMISLKIFLSILSSFNSLNPEAFLNTFPILIGTGFKSVFLALKMVFWEHYIFYLYLVLFHRIQKIFRRLFINLLNYFSINKISRFLIFVSQYKQILSNKLLFDFWTFFWLKIIFVLYSTIKIKKIDSSYKLFTFLMKIIL